MPRLARKYLESPFLHIIIQGIDKSYIFQENSLKTAYKTILKKNIESLNVEVLAYCIMDNHVHLLLYGENTNEIAKIMHRTNTSYARLYNKVNQRVGYVFRDRYYVQMILSEKQLYNCIAYIHKNPLNAGMVKHLKDYKYSSYIEYIDKRDFITDNSVKLVFGNLNNYLDIFNEIHRINNIEDIKDIVEEPKNPKTILNDYLKDKSKSLDEIKLDKKLLGELLIKLRFDSRIIFERYGNSSKY